jgi:non-lysosomal glucosylceramidase
MNQETFTMPDSMSVGAKLRAFTGESLRKVAFPLGGIGTGTVSLGGRGSLRDWEIFNHPGKGRNLPYTFFALYAKPAGGPAAARVLERRLLPPYDSGFGLSTGQVSGLPRLKEALYTGGYPLAVIAFEDETLPLEVALHAFNPFIPMNDRDSGIPVAVFTWMLKNPGSEPVEATVCFSLLNACGYDGHGGAPGNRHHPQLGRNLNEFIRQAGLSGIRMSTQKYAPDHPQFGTMAMATSCETVTWRTRWERAGWWDDAQSFWDDFADDGLLPDGPEPNPSPDGQSDVGSLGARVTLAPGGEARIPFLLAWHFPNLVNEWNEETAVKGRRLGNWYAAQWPDAWAAARYTHENLPRLREETQTFFDTFFASSLPAEVLDAASANASIMRTTTCLRTEDGRFNGFEGCGDDRGCCPMNCTHVWNYEQAVAHLFPALERTVRRTDFTHNTRPDGNMAFRTLLPLVGELWTFKPAADGQMGTVMKVYREWLQCGDRAFLEEMWPGVVRALEHAWQPGSWDADKDGVMEGEQHNTYDIEFYGPNTMMGTFYLGALRAAEEMAKALGHEEKAKEYRAVYESGRAKYAASLFNGDYFTQTVRSDIWEEKRGPVSAETHPDAMLTETEPRYQYGPGCLADQMLGQWFARVVGLGDLLPPERVKSAVAAIFRHNFRRDLSGHATVQRVYALNDEAGLLLCTWPNGGRPKYPFPYADEVWTGIEYQVAAHLIYEGLMDEGLEMVRAVRDRHDGAKRNPWDEFECGHHYARAMSSWSLLLALSGCRYDAAKGFLAFAPKVNADDFRCFFSAGTAWGMFTQKREAGRYTATVQPRWGEVTLQTLGLPLDSADTVTVMLDGAPVEARLVEGAFAFAAPVTLRAGQRLEVRA